jgi:hypothetical protein
MAELPEISEVFADLGIGESEAFAELLAGDSSAIDLEKRFELAML